MTDERNCKDQIFETLKGKKYIKVVGTKGKPTCPLEYHHKLTYSILRQEQRIFKGKHKGMSAESIAARLGSGVYRETISKSLKRLVGWGLATNMGKRGSWIALEPSGEVASWFAWTDTDKAWYERLASHRVYLPAPSSPLSTKENGLLWLIHSLANDDGRAWNRGRGQTKEALGRLLPYGGKRHVLEAIKTLQTHKLISVSAMGFNVLLPPNPSYWLGPINDEKPPKPKEKEPMEKNPDIEKLFDADGSDDNDIRAKNMARFEQWQREAKTIKAGIVPDLDISGYDDAMEQFERYQKTFWPIMSKAGLSVQDYQKFWQAIITFKADPVSPHDHYPLLEFCFRFPERFEPVRTKYTKTLNVALMLKLYHEVWKGS